ncbi:MAG TPA: hypothetical protein VGL40_01290 [Bacillota bacterium]
MRLINLVTRRRLLVGVLTVLVAGSTVWAWAAATGRGPSTVGRGAVAGSSATPTETASPGDVPARTINILFMGVDQRTGDVGAVTR